VAVLQGVPSVKACADQHLTRPFSWLGSETLAHIRAHKGNAVVSPAGNRHRVPWTARGPPDDSRSAEGPASRQETPRDSRKEHDQ